MQILAITITQQIQRQRFLESYVRKSGIKDPISDRPSDIPNDRPTYITHPYQHPMWFGLMNVNKLYHTTPLSKKQYRSKSPVASDYSLSRCDDPTSYSIRKPRKYDEVTT